MAPWLKSCAAGPRAQQLSDLDCGGRFSDGGK